MEFCLQLVLQYQIVFFASRMKLSFQYVLLIVVVQRYKQCETPYHLAYKEGKFDDVKPIVCKIIFHVAYKEGQYDVTEL